MNRTGLICATLVAAALSPLAAGATSTRAFVVTTDFNTGVLSAVNLASRAVVMDSVTIHSDASVRWHEGLVYVVNRTPQDNIQVVDPAHAYATIRQFTTGNGSNPYDIAFTSPTKAYVTRYGRSSLLVVNPLTGMIRDSILLAPFADSDGIPEMDHMFVLGKRLFVSLQRLTNFTPSSPSLIAVIDTDADTLIDVDRATPGTQPITLAARNPVTRYDYDPKSGRLFVGCAGAYGSLDGGVEAIDPVHLRSLGLAITETELGGDVGSVIWKNGTHAYALVSNASFQGSLVSWNPATGMKLATLMGPGDYLADAAMNDRGEVWVCDNDFFGVSGLYVFSTANDQLVAGPITSQLPPFAIAFDQPELPAAAPLPNVSPLALGAPFPNPARTVTSFGMLLARAGEVRVDVFDASGRRIRTLVRGDHAGGTSVLRWDLRDETGREVRSGVYLVRARGTGIEAARRVAVFR